MLLDRTSCAFSRKAFAVALCLCWLGASHVDVSADEAAIRVAVIDAGSTYPAPPELIDLMIARLSRRPGLSVLERQEIDAILREQGNSLALNRRASPDDAIAAGRIVGADALVLLVAAPAIAEGPQPIEISIVETRRGIRLGRTTLAWSTSDDSIDQQVRSVASRLVQQLRRVPSANDQSMAIALAGFRSDELSQEAHRLRRTLEAGIEAWLANQQGIGVAERSRMLQLIDERRLANDLPAALKGADAVIDGLFHLDFSQETPMVELELRVKKNDSPVRTRVLVQRLDQQATLRQATGEAILELLEISESEGAFDAQAEAKLLTEEAERLLQLGRRVESLDRLTAAYALAPDDFQIQRLMLAAGVQLGVGPDISGATFEGPFYPTALLLSDVARKVLDQLEQGQLRQSEPGAPDRSRLLERIGALCKLMSQVQFAQTKESPNRDVYHEWLRSAVGDLFSRYLALTAELGGGDYEMAIYCGLQNGRYWASGPQEALDLRRDLLLRAAALSERGQFGIWAITADHRFRLADDKTWAKRADLNELYDAYFQGLAQSDHAAVRAVGERDAACHALLVLEDRQRAMMHYRKFIGSVVEKVIPHYPDLADEVHSQWLHLNYRTGRLALTDEEAGELWSRVIRARWSTEQSPPQASQHWEHFIKKTMLHLEQAGRPEQADDLLRTCLDALHAAAVGGGPDQVPNQWSETSARLQLLRQGLAERRSEVGSDLNEASTAAVRCEECFNVEELVTALPPRSDGAKLGWRFSGIAPSGAGYVVSCSSVHGIAPTDAAKTLKHHEWLAIARLDKRGNLASASLFPEALPYDYRASRLTGDVGRTIRPMAATNEGVFIALPMSGLIWFRNSGDPVHFSPRHLEEPDATHRPAPFDEVRQIIAVDDKLFLTTGYDLLSPILYELDYRRGTATSLFDANSLAEDGLLAGKKVFAFDAGPPGSLIVWALPDGSNRGGNRAPGHLFLLSVKTKSLRQPAEVFQLAHPWAGRSAQHRLGFQTADGAIAVFEPKTLSMTPVTSSESTLAMPPQQARLAQVNLAYNGRHVLTTAKRPGGVSPNEWRLYTGGGPQESVGPAADWLLYERDRVEPCRLAGAALPPVETVSSYLIDDDSQVLMVANEAVFRVTLPARIDAETPIANEK